jgi:hypothetical protein
MLYPNRTQVAILFDRRINTLARIAQSVDRFLQVKFGVPFNLAEANPGYFYRFFGAHELMITLEYVDNPADASLFRPALSSAVTGIYCSDVRERLMVNKSLVLVEVSHGVLGNSPEVQRLLAQLEMPAEGHSLPQFFQRLEVAELLTKIVCDEERPQLIHWTQSDQLMPPEAFGALAEGEGIKHLHIHPFLFGESAKNGQNAKVGIRTFGARHFIGREIIVEPNPLPWAANYETLMAFLRVAVMPNGYVIPNGDTFGPEDRSLSYRVLHHDAQEDGVPIYELVPLMYREHNFVAADYVPDDRVINDRVPPAELMPVDDEEKMELANEWREKRTVAERAGARFEVRHRDAAPAPNPPAPSGGFGNSLRRAIFGRK